MMIPVFGAGPGNVLSTCGYASRSSDVRLPNDRGPEHQRLDSGLRERALEQRLRLPNAWKAKVRPYCVMNVDNGRAETGR
ncbi:MAG: hypothetical protein R2849_08470 [Thermomicrobiales bacterium]